MTAPFNPGRGRTERHQSRHPRGTPIRRYAWDCTASDLRLATLCYGPCHGRARPGACSTAVSDLYNDPRPLRPPVRHRHAPGPRATHYATSPSRAPSAAAKHPETGRRPHAHACPAQQLRSSPEYAARTARPWPSVESPTVCTDRPGSPDVVRYASVDTATHRLTVTHADTRRDKKKTAPRARFRSQGAVSAGSGRCWVRTNVG